MESFRLRSMATFWACKVIKAGEGRETPRRLVRKQRETSRARFCGFAVQYCVWQNSYATHANFNVYARPLIYCPYYILTTLTGYPHRTLHPWPHSGNSLCVNCQSIQLLLHYRHIENILYLSHCLLGFPLSLFPSIFPSKMTFPKPSLLFKWP